MAKQKNKLKFAYWAPNVSGGLVFSNIPQRTSWDFDYNKKLAKIAEKNGFEYALVQIRFTAGYGAEYQHESVTFSQAILSQTKKLNVIAAILPGPWKPSILAKQIATISTLYNGRIAVNIVSGWFRGEFHAIGEHWLDHDERYRRSEEFIRAIKGIWTNDSFTFKGDFYNFNNYKLNPKPKGNPHPEIFQGGTSKAARIMASKVSNWYFANGDNIENLKKQIDEVKKLAQQEKRNIKIGVNAFVIARDTEEEAINTLNDIIKHKNDDALLAFKSEVKNAGKSTLEKEGMWANSSLEDLVQYNDGFKTNLIGTPNQIAHRIIKLKEIGVDLILIGFLHFIEEVEYFGKNVLPLVRELEKQKQLEKTI